jgi:ubiquinone/menaquinone biosynthesis C-methylase UbiE
LSDTETSRAGVQHWDAFWRAREKAIGQEDAGARDRAPALYWESLFREALESNPRARIIDIACGNGAVTAIAIAAAQDAGANVDVHCIDYSMSAVDELRKRFPEVEGVACDARAIPYNDGEFDMVVSQFGIEYAGPDAFLEAARLVAPGGTLTALAHLAEGAIYKECADNLAVAVALREARLMALARDAFTAGFALIAGKITDPEFQEADKRLAPAVELAKQILRDKGPLAAGGLLANLYRDIGHMYTRMQNYVPAEIFAWFDGMSGELVSYEGRMASMTRSALDEQGAGKIAASVGSMGFTVEPPDVLSLAESGQPAAWILTARKGR